MSDGQPIITERVIPFAYGVVDATFFDYLELVADRTGGGRLSIQRTPLTSASSRYTLTLDSLKIPSTILIRMVGIQHTHCAVEGGTADLRAFVMRILNTFIGYIYSDQMQMREFIDREPEAVQDFARADVTVDDMLAEFVPVQREAARTRKPPGPKPLKVNDWAREEAATGKTIDELLPEYARRRRLKDLVEARELLRKAINPPKRKQSTE